MSSGPDVIVTVSRAEQVTGDDLLRAYADLRARGFRPLWPPVHCPAAGMDRFLICGAVLSAPRVAQLEAGPGGNFQF